MSIFGHRIEGLIDQLEQRIPDVDTTFNWGGEVQRHDWRPVWALCKEIQEEFRNARDFKSREAQQAAWERFAALRSKGSELADHEKEAFGDQSKRLRDELFYEMKGVGWSPIDDIMFFFDPTTVEEIKSMGQTLHDVGQKLSDNKNLMLGEHKTEVFERMQDKRSQLDHFWEKRREAQGQRQREYQERHDAWRERVSANLQRNREKLAKAQAAASHTRDRISENEDKLRDTDSPKWEGIFSEWIEGDIAKLADIEDSIDRLEGWIAEDEDKLSG